MTAAPRVIDTFKDLDFVFNNEHRFTSIFNDEEGFFQQAERPSTRGPWKTNYIADVWSLAPKQRASAEELEAKARAAAKRGDGWKSVGRFLTGEQGGAHGANALMLRGTVHAAVELPVPAGDARAAPSSRTGIHVTVIGGHGYSIMQSPAMDQTVKVPWGTGHASSSRRKVGGTPTTTSDPSPGTGCGSDGDPRSPSRGAGPTITAGLPREGGDQIAFKDMDPSFHREFEEELAKAGIKCLMLHHPHCSFR